MPVIISASPRCGAALATARTRAADDGGRAAMLAGLAAALARRGDPAAAERLIHEASDALPGAPAAAPVRIRIAAACAAAGLADDALAALRDAPAAEPDGVPFAATAGALAGAGATAEALALLAAPGSAVARAAGLCAAAPALPRPAFLQALDGAARSAAAERDPGARMRAWGDVAAACAIAGLPGHAGRVLGMLERGARRDSAAARVARILCAAGAATAAAQLAAGAGLAGALAAAGDAAGAMAAARAESDPGARAVAMVAAAVGDPRWLAEATAAALQAPLGTAARLLAGLARAAVAAGCPDDAERAAAAADRAAMRHGRPAESCVERVRAWCACGLTDRATAVIQEPVVRTTRAMALVSAAALAAGDRRAAHTALLALLSHAAAEPAERRWDAFALAAETLVEAGDRAGGLLTLGAGWEAVGPRWRAQAAERRAGTLLRAGEGGLAWDTAALADGMAALGRLLDVGAAEAALTA